MRANSPSKSWLLLAVALTIVTVTALPLMIGSAGQISTRESTLTKQWRPVESPEPPVQVVGVADVEQPPRPRPDDSRTRKGLSLPPANFWHTRGCNSDVSCAELDAELRHQAAWRRAASQLEMLCEDGDKSACLMAAELYRRGTGVPSDTHRAIELAKSAGAVGNAAISQWGREVRRYVSAR